MRERYTERLTINLTETLKDKIKNAAAKLDWNVSDVVRECVEVELSRLIDRENKRTKRRTQQNDNS